MFKQHRIALQLSQSELARRSGVPRLRVHLAEHGDVTLTEDERTKIRAALQAEMDRLRSLSVNLDFTQPDPEPNPNTCRPRSARLVEAIHVRS
jgi:transcriptional regulator with XRE-family HTH domain